MRKFFFNILYFLSVPVLLICTLETGIAIVKPKLFTENNLELKYAYESKDYNWINTIGGDSLIVLAGSSSVRYGLSCSMLNQLENSNTKYVNIAMDSRDPISTYFILKNIKDKRITTLYFGLDPWIFTKGYYKYRNSYLYLDFGLIDFFRFAYEQDKNAFLKRYKGFINLSSPGNSDTQPGSQQIPTDFGSVVLEKKANNFETPVNELFQIEKYGWSDLQFIYLKKISDLCKERSIKMAVFIPPKRSDYSKNYREKCMPVHKEYIDHLSKTGFSEPIFGTFDQLDKIGDSALFVETYHLNKKGQYKYSELFYKMTKENMSLFSGSYKWLKNEH